jgi:hypothetical protein
MGAPRDLPKAKSHGCFFPKVSNYEFITIVSCQGNAKTSAKTKLAV